MSAVVLTAHTYCYRFMNATRRSLKRREVETNARITSGVFFFEGPSHSSSKFFDEKEYWVYFVDDASASFVVLDICTVDSIGFGALLSLGLGLST